MENSQLVLPRTSCNNILLSTTSISIIVSDIYNTSTFPANLTFVDLIITVVYVKWNAWITLCYFLTLLFLFRSYLPVSSSHPSVYVLPLTWESKFPHSYKATGRATVWENHSSRCWIMLGSRWQCEHVFAQATWKCRDACVSVNIHTQD
jgi:hypothetical protein